MHLVYPYDAVIIFYKRKYGFFFKMVTFFRMKPKSIRYLETLCFGIKKNNYNQILINKLLSAFR